MKTLNQLGLLDIYKCTINKYFDCKFRSSNGEWYRFLKELSEAQGIRMAQVWYHFLYILLDDK